MAVWQIRQNLMNPDVYATIFMNLFMLMYMQTFAKLHQKCSYGLSQGDEIPGETVSSSWLTSVFNFFQYTFCF